MASGRAASLAVGQAEGLSEAREAGKPRFKSLGIGAVSAGSQASGGLRSLSSLRREVGSFDEVGSKGKNRWI